MTIEIKHLVVAFGGEYGDRWDKNIRAFSTAEAAQALIANYEKWLMQARQMEYPEACAEHNMPDSDDERAFEIFSEMQRVFEEEFMAGLGIPPEDREWIMENRSGSYSCDRPRYKIEQLEFSNT